MEPLTTEQLRQMQQRQWDEEAGRLPVAQAATAQTKTRDNKPNPYINIIRKDMVCVRNVVNTAGWSPISWFRLWRMRRSGEYRDFMEQHFGKKLKKNVVPSAHNP